MLESMDVGFRGMSGAVAVNENGKCVGMFVKRGKLISLKPPRMVTAEGTSAMKYEDTEETMGFATAVPAASQSSWFEQLLFPSCFHGSDDVQGTKTQVPGENPTTRLLVIC